MRILHQLFLVAFNYVVFLILSSSSTSNDYCSVGHLYEPADTRISYPRGWYLNLEHPSTCSGNVTNVTMYYYIPTFVPGNYCVWWALFEPLGFNTFVQVKNSLHITCLDITSQSEAATHTVQLPIDSQFPVLKGSIVGSFFQSSQETLPIIGDDLEDSGDYPNSRLCYSSAVDSHTSSAVSSHSSSAVSSHTSSAVSSHTSSAVSSHTSSAVTSSIYCDPFYTNDRALHMKMDIDIILCPTVDQLANGDIYYDDEYGREYGGIVYYICDYGYRLNGDAERTCLSNGTWSGTDTKCVSIECPELLHPENGLVVYSDRNYGSVAFFYCNEGFALRGLLVITCLISGEWSNSLSSCDPIQCSSIPHIPNTYHTPDEVGSYVFGDKVLFYCNAGYELVGSGVLTCTSNGVWNSTFPICIIARNMLPINTAFLNTSSLTSMHITTTLIKKTTQINDVTLYTKIITSSTSTMIPSKCVLSTCSNVASSTGEMNNFVTKSLNATKTNGPGNSGNISGLVSGDGGERILSLSLKTFVLIVAIFSVVVIPLIMIAICLCISLLRKRRREKIVKMKIKSEELQYSIPIDAIQTNEGPVAESSDTDEPFHKYEYLADVQDTTEYEEPAQEEVQLYMQLDRIKVRKIPRQNLLILGPLGSGQFGSVHYSVWDCNTGKTNVAVKTFRQKPSKRDKLKILQEATIMGQFQHKNVLTLHGIVQDTIEEEILLVVELMVKGDLRNFLKQTMKKKVTTTAIPLKLLGFCRQICEGMCYLSRKGYVHRDLAARNILVSEDYCCKISDFGMSRDLEDGYYLAQRGGVIPFKWTAPEAINFRKYSTASDVWSYGCVLYEIWSLGCQPFDNVDSRKVLMKLERGYRLPPPPGCPKKLYETMISTWHPEPKERPSFCIIMTNLLCTDDEMLHIPEQDRHTHPQAGNLDAHIDAGHNMYKALQNSYSYYFTITND